VGERRFLQTVFKITATASDLGDIRLDQHEVYGIIRDYPADLLQDLIQDLLATQRAVQNFGDISQGLSQDTLLFLGGFDPLFLCQLLLKPAVQVTPAPDDDPNQQKRCEHSPRSIPPTSAVPIR
jgi:hypothetical protein